MEENTNPQNQTPPQPKPLQKDGLLPGQEQEVELNLIGDAVYSFASLLIGKLKNLFQKRISLF